MSERVLLLKQKKTTKAMVGYEKITREFIQYRFFENKEKAKEFIKNNTLVNNSEGFVFSYRLLNFNKLEDLNERPKRE